MGLPETSSLLFMLFCMGRKRRKRKYLMWLLLIGAAAAGIITFLMYKKAEK